MRLLSVRFSRLLARTLFSWGRGMIRYWLHLVLVYSLSPFLSECGTSGNNPVICRCGSAIAAANFNLSSVNALFCFAARQIRFVIASALGCRVLGVFRRLLSADVYPL